VARFGIALALGLALVTVGLWGYAATTTRSEPLTRPCGGRGGNAPDSPIDPLCPLVNNACNDENGCVCGGATCTYWYHYGQTRCTWWGRLRGCEDAVHEYCYRIWTLSREECETFNPNEHRNEGMNWSCEAHCGASNGHPCSY